MPSQWERYNLTNSIAIYDDRIEIANPGVFPPEITSETIKNPHDSYPYNPKIAEALYRTTWLENWGTGVKRIIDACSDQGVEEPTWRWDGGFIYVTFKRPSYKSNPHEKVGDNVASKESNVPQNVPQNDTNVPQKTKEELQNKIIGYIRGNSTISREEIAAKLRVTSKTVGRHLAQMGIFWEGHSKTGHWIISDIKQLDNGKEENR